MKIFDSKKNSQSILHNKWALKYHELYNTNLIILLILELPFLKMNKTIDDSVYKAGSFETAITLIEHLTILLSQFFFLRKKMYLHA